MPKHVRRKLRKANLGRVAWNKGLAWNDEAKEKMRNAKLGTKQSEKTKKKRIKTLTGLKRSPDTCERIRQAKLGKPRTEEAKAALRAAWVIRKQRDFPHLQASRQA